MWEDKIRIDLRETKNVLRQNKRRNVKRL